MFYSMIFDNVQEISFAFSSKFDSWKVKKTSKDQENVLYDTHKELWKYSFSYCY